jgi:UDP-N-acetylglucosamine 3-dehydrogenase
MQPGGEPVGHLAPQGESEGEIMNTSVGQAPLRVAVIGVGEMGRNHARVFSEMPEVNLVAVADMNMAAARAAARFKGVEAYDDFDRMLDEARPEAVTIAVPTSLHAEVAAKVIERGIHVLLEKPIALNVEQAREIIQKARLHGVRLAVGHVERFNPAVRALKKLLHSGQLGRTFQVCTRRQGPYPARIRDVGVTIDLAVHDLDIIRYITGAEVSSLYAVTGSVIGSAFEDNVHGMLHLTNGAVASVTANWITPTKIRELSVIGESGMFRVDYLTQDLFFYENDHRPAQATDWDTMVVMRGVREGRMIRHMVVKKEPLRAELEAFVALARGEASDAVSAADGREALRLAQLMLHSSALHMPVSCNEAALSLTPQPWDMLPQLEPVPAR